MDIQSLVLDKAVKIDGWMSFSELELLASLASKANNIVEFGSYKGRSTRALADNTKGMVHAVDPWNGKYKNNDGIEVDFIERAAGVEFIQNLKDHLELGTVRPFVGYSHEFVKYCPIRADLIFIDGDHRYEEVLNDIRLADRIRTWNGIICGHDYGRQEWPGVKKAVDQAYPQEIEVVDTIWIKRF